ncbi:MAG: S9 family peptidase [Ornithinimicrobium sp.]
MTETCKPASAPVAARRPHTRTHHGETIQDDYEWLRDKSNPEVIAHLEAENAYTEAMTDHVADLRADIFTEIKGHTQESDLSVPVRHGRWWYYTRTVEGEQYPLYARVAVEVCRERPTPEPGHPPAHEEVVLDANAEAAGEEFFSLGAFDVSPSGEVLAYAVDTTGDERFDLRVKDVRTSEILDAAVLGIGYSVAWSLDEDYLFYTRVDEAWRPHQVWRHAVGGPADHDVLVHVEDDERFWIGLGTSRDDRFVVVGSASKNSSECWMLDASTPTAEFSVVAPRVEGVEYDVEPAGERLWIVHNRTHRDFELSWAPLGSSSADDWRTVVPGRDGVRVVGVDAFAGHLALSLRRDGLAEVDLIGLDQRQEPIAGQHFSIPVDESLYTVEVGSNPDYDSQFLQVRIESMVTPPSIYDVSVQTGEKTLLKRQPVPGGYDPANYRQHRLWADASDGTRIPISLVVRADVEPDGTAAGLLYGYGAYEICIDPWFSAARLSYLDRGVVYAVAHVRGGGEMGRSWYENGRMEFKENTFTDFVACADHLVESGWVAAQRLAAEGGSAGGLLVGAALNLAPGRFRVVHAAVPFVDALTTILDPSLPLTVVEWEEWGDPLHDVEVYRRMRGYTPYENVAATEYPAILATTGLNDTRVYYVEPAKWVARLRGLAANDPATRPILLKTEMVAGHGGKTGRYDAWHDAAFEIAMIVDQLGATQMRA